MKICFYNDIYILGGGELWVLNACQHLRESGHEVAVVCPWRSPLHDQCQAAGIEVFCFFRMEGLPNYEPVYHFLEKNNFDILYCTIIGGICEAMVLETMVDRINCHRPDSRMALVLKTGLPPMANLTPQYYGIGSGTAIPRLHVVSERNRQSFIQWLHHHNIRFDENFIETIREGVDLNRFNDFSNRQSVNRSNLGISANQQLVSCIARLHTMKGQENLLRAIPGVIDKHPDTVFLFAGDGEDRARLESIRDQLGLSDQVRFLGHIEDVPALLSITDILCHPSLADGLPNSIVEAMAAGVPVLASDTDGIPELIQHEKSGLLINPYNVATITRLLNRLLASPDLRGAYAKQGKYVIQNNFDIRKNLQHLITRLKDDLETVRNGKGITSINAYTQQSPAPIPVMFLMNSVRTGGEESEVKILARYLNRSRFPLSVLSLYDVGEAAPAIEELLASGITIDTACHGLPGTEEKVQYVVNKIRKEQIRIVVACQDTRTAFHVFNHILPDECRLIEHGGIIEETSAIPKHLTRFYIGVSRDIRDAAAALMPDRSRAAYIPSMIDTREFEGLDRRSLRKAYGFSDDDTVVIFVGRIDPKKRIELLLQAAATLIPAYRQLHFLIVGGADAYSPEYLKQLLNASQLLINTGRLAFTGTRGDVPALMTAANILILPGTGEGMSHVISEAGAAGLAVVASDDGSAREQLDDGKGGYIFSQEQPNALLNTLVTVLENPADRIAKGLHLRKKVAAEYSADVLIPQWEKLLHEAGSETGNAHELYIHSLDRGIDFPTEIQIQTITSCNASCVMCPYPEVSKEFPLGRMSEEVYDRIIDECAQESGLRRIEPFLMNEAFTDKRIIELISKTKQKVPHAMVTVTTNGSPLTPSVSDRLVKTGLDAIWFSFNGANPETYEKIMGIPYDKVKRNLDYLLNIKPPDLHVFVNMIETELMAPEIEQNIRYWQSRGVQAGSSPLVNRAGNVTNFNDLNYKPISNHPVRTCELPFYKMYIIHNGDVVLCCMDWRRTQVVGNVMQQSIRDIWNGQEYRRIRQLHIEGRDAELELCSRCSYTLS